MPIDPRVAREWEVVVKKRLDPFTPFTPLPLYNPFTPLPLRPFTFILRNASQHAADKRRAEHSLRAVAEGIYTL